MHRSLSEFESHRYDWAIAAKEDFLDNFGMYDARRTAIQDGQDTILSVYGPTQVGKTTLILELLSMKGTKIEKISPYLRGAREIGNSSTVTVTRYGVSPDEDFHVAHHGEDPESFGDPHALETYLARLRTKAERGEVDPTRPTVIRFPRSYFHEPDVIVDIIDLPGIESAEVSELVHVQACIDFWLPKSHACLIVNGATDLTFLRDLDTIQLKRWYQHPENFYVVLTRACSPQSIRDRLEGGRIRSFPELQQYYVEEVRSVVGYASQSIFPVDIGMSRGRLDENGSRISDDGISILREKIRAMDFRYLSFSFLTKYYTEVVLESEEEIADIRKRLDEAQKNTDVTGDHVSILDASHEREQASYRNLCNRIRVDREKISRLFAEIDRQRLMGEFINGRLDEIKDEKSRDMLNNQFSGILDSVNEEIRSVVRKVNHVLRILRQLEPSLHETGRRLELLDEGLEVQFFTWDDSLIDLYISHKNYQKQLKKMTQEFLEMLADVLGRISEEEERIIANLDDMNEKLEQKMTHHLYIHEQTRTAMMDDLKRGREEIAALDKELSDTEGYWQRDIEHAKRYRMFFKKHLSLRKKELLVRAVAKDPLERYHSFLALYVLEADARKIIDALETRDGTD